VHEINGPGGDQIDLLIENVVARRGAEGTATLALDPLSSDEALVAGLASLTAADWPADEAGDRIAMSVRVAIAPLAAAAADAVVAPDRRAGTGMHQRWPARSRWLVAAAAAVVLALVGAAVGLAGGAPGAARPGSGTAAVRPKTESAKPPMVLTAMKIVSEPGALRGIGLTPTGNPFLTCVTPAVCYTDGYRGTARFIARTVDGGATWRAGAALPGPTNPADTEWDTHVSCRTPLRCVSAYFSGMLETSDGFSRVRFQPIVGRADDVEWATCSTRLDCVAEAYVGRGDEQKFLYSADGGRSWAAAVAPSIGTDAVAQLTCDASGACVAALSGGDEGNGTVAALSSDDAGRTWVMSATYSVGTEQQYWASCGDAHDCVIGGNSGAVPLAWIHVTASGAISIRLHPEPLQAEGTGISCATASDCFMTAGDTVEATYNGGQSWIAVPTAPPAQGGGATLVDVSCPVAAGCIGLAQANGSDWAVVSDLPHGR
jgi:hypothetical protein